MAKTKNKNAKKGMPSSTIAIMGFGLILVSFGILTFVKSTEMGSEFMENILGYHDQKCVESLTNPKYTEDIPDKYPYDDPITREEAKQYCALTNDNDEPWVRCKFTGSEIGNIAEVGTAAGVSCLLTTGGNIVICTGATTAMTAWKGASLVATNCNFSEGTYGGIRGSKGYKRAMLVKVITEEGIEAGILGAMYAVGSAASDLVQTAGSNKNSLAGKSAAQIESTVTESNWKQYAYGTGFAVSALTEDVKKAHFGVTQQAKVVQKLIESGASQAEIDAAKGELHTLRGAKLAKRVQLKQAKTSLATIGNVLDNKAISSGGKARYGAKISRIGVKSAKMFKNSKIFVGVRNGLGQIAQSGARLGRIAQSGALKTIGKTVGKYVLPGITIASAVGGAAVVAGIADPAILPNEVEDGLSAMSPFGIKLRLFGVDTNNMENPIW